MNENKIIDLAEKRGYSLYSHTSNHDIYTFLNNLGICLKVYINTNEFVLSYNINLFVLTSNKCGSFDNDKHFKFFENKIINYCLVLGDK